MQPTSMTFSNRVALSQSYDRAIKSAVVQQLVFSALALLLLDGGQAARNLACCIAVFWVVVAMFALRRPIVPTAADLAIVRWGSLPLAVLAFTYR
jgi:hypothetical protein